MGDAWTLDANDAVALSLCSNCGVDVSDGPSSLDSIAGNQVSEENRLFAGPLIDYDPFDAFQYHFSLAGQLGHLRSGAVKLAP